MFQRMAMVDDTAFEAIAAFLEDAFAVCSIITDPEGRPADYRFLRVNRRFQELTGFEDAQGRTALDLVPTLEPKWIELYGRVAQGGEPLRFKETSLVTGRDYEVLAAPVNAPGCFALLLRDLTDLRRLEADQAAALEHAQNLLKELNHRVMNSFASISAIVAMERRAAPEGARPPLERLQGRIQALAALYRRLDGVSQIDRIDVAEYIGGNVASFRDAMGAAGPLSVSADLASLTLPTRLAVPLGLVVNELLSNAARHAFARGRAGTIHVALSYLDGLCRLVVSDDRCGEAEGSEDEGIGQSLIDAFASELGGEISVRAGPDGTSTTLEFRA
ncbi:sensor histidine kinase [Rubellimicrobium arenae]|uniref:sensor histidine kinase n=1 Tax=Rubellimicrobium arenae TaxID=2817372 RepID=UPI001B30EC0A|nr:histidine kinase dimerization/phosphoacceptor domain -containing protein [Rubellimicrobium arenae]